MFEPRYRVILPRTIWLVLLLGVPAVLPAQQLDGLRPRTVVRLTAPTVAADPLVGTVASVTAEEVVLRVSGERELVRVPAHAVEQVEILRDPRAHPVLRAVGGILTGVAIVLAVVVYGAIAG